MEETNERPTAVQTIGLTRRFGHKVAVDQLDLSVAEGEFFGFLGPNGAGKSTTINMLVGLLRPTEGRALIQGIDIWEQPLQAKQHIGVLPEGLNLYERLSGREFIRFAGTMYGLEAGLVEARTEELLQLMDLEEDAGKLIVDYSTGMRKKTALGAAIIHSPRILFLDSPLKGSTPFPAAPYAPCCNSCACGARPSSFRHIFWKSWSDYVRALP